MVLYIIVNVLRLVSNPIKEKLHFYSCSTLYHVNNRINWNVSLFSGNTSHPKSRLWFCIKKSKRRLLRLPNNNNNLRRNDQCSNESCQIRDDEFWDPQKNIFYLVRSNSFFSTFGDGWILHSTSSVSVLSTKLNKLQFHTFVGEELNIFVRKK